MTFSKYKSVKNETCCNIYRIERYHQVENLQSILSNSTFLDRKSEIGKNE